MNIIINIPNPSGAYQSPESRNVESAPDGYIEITCDYSEFFNGFIVPTIENDIVTGFVCNTEAWEAWKAVPIETLRADKLNSLNGMCSGAIYAGLTINGKHYNFTALAQESIKGLMQEIQQGSTIVPYKADGEGYTPHTAEQMTIIAKTMSEWIKANTHYYDLLKAWVERETDETIIDSIHYGSQLPNDLVQTLTLQLAQYGIDITKYASMLGG